MPDTRDTPTIERRELAEARHKEVMSAIDAINRILRGNGDGNTPGHCETLRSHDRRIGAIEATAAAVRGGLWFLVVRVATVAVIACLSAAVSAVIVGRVIGSGL